MSVCAGCHKSPSRCRLPILAEYAICNFDEKQLCLDCRCPKVIQRLKDERRENEKREKEEMRKLQEERQDRLNRTKAHIRAYFKENPEEELCYREYTVWYLCRHCDEVVTSEHFGDVCGYCCIHSCISKSVEPCQLCTYIALSDP